MKIKTINAVICKKFDEFAASITDDKVRELVKSNTIITGGCIASMLLREPVNDYDLYFRNRETALAVALYYVGEFNKAPDSSRQATVVTKNDAMAVTDDGCRVTIKIKSIGVAQANNAPDNSGGVVEIVEEADEIPAESLDEKPSYRPTFLSSNAITLSGKIQVIIRFYGEPKDIHDNYDFVHCMNYWDSSERKVTVRPDSLEALLTKELRYVGSKYPICSVIRTRKFLCRGWTINAGQYLKMCLQIGELDLKNLAVLEDQLVGVDAAYFQQVIYNLREKDQKVVDSAYLMTLIDRIF